MIIPSIDIMDGRAIQLRQGRERLLDGGEPLQRLEEFAVAGEVAVIDLDAALGQGDNTALIRNMARRAPIRVGGGIRSAAAALDWLDAGAARIIIGTRAEPELCGRLPRERVIAAVDARCGKLVIDGWRRETGRPVLERIHELAPHVGGFLLTQVEHEGEMAGFSSALVSAAIRAAGDARVTAAGGITSAAEIAALDALGADAQVGMAIYSGRLSLGAAVAAPLAKPVGEGLWPTVVCDPHGATLGLVWSTRESLEAAVTRRQGVYWSRSRGTLWVKGETSGATQVLKRVELDCDRDALRFTVEQRDGFCHTGARACWPDRFDLGALERVVRVRQARPPQGSGTARLIGDPALLAAKLTEEAGELAAAEDASAATQEAADLVYFTLVALAAKGGTLEGVEAELARRALRVRRRSMKARPAA